MSTQMESNKNDADLLLSPSAKTARQLKSLYSRHGSNSHINTKRNHFAARKRRSWVKKLKNQIRRNERRNSDLNVVQVSNRSIAFSIDSDSNATDRVHHVPPMKKQISFNLNNLQASDSHVSDGDNHDSFNSSFKTKLNSTVKNLMKPFLKGNGRNTSMNKQNNVSFSRTSNGSISIKSSEFSGSEGVDNFDLSFSIMPRESMRNLMSQRNLNPDLLDTMDEIDKVGVLAESRTPSFNVMLHANEIYSDTCTILKRKTVRISWVGLANNTNTPAEELSEDFIRDIGGRAVSEKRFDGVDTTEGPSEIFGLRGLKPRGSILVRRPSKKRDGSNKGGVPLWSGTSTIDFNNNFSSFVTYEKTKDWLKSFKTCDPRYQILTFFNDVANEGATGDSENFKRDHVSPLLKYLDRSSVFSVWRPTSFDSIRRMMLGEGVGKGLDIKGKSAKRGKLSAFVPFLQIFHEEDKEKVRNLHKDSKIRIFFNSDRDRNLVMTNLNELAKELEETIRAARQIYDDQEHHDEETFESAMQKMVLDMKDPAISTIDTYVSSNKYGIEVQERLFWEGMVVRQNIYRKPGSRDDIGRTSMPSFQDMNFSSLREPRNSMPGGHTRAVIMHYNPPGEENNPMNPLNLLMAYEENDPKNNRCRVIPVVSDFDCFIVGTRGVKYEKEVPEDQVKVLKWMIKQTEGILDKPSTESWTKRWLDVLKEAGNKGFHPKIPTGGYSDPKTKFIFRHAINRLGTTGAVRHGAECYNYYFPQDLDEGFLVISDELPDNYCRFNWTYVDRNALKNILKFKIDKGYTFPLNPKWILCDPGWKEVYDKLRSSDAPNVQQSLNCFYPPKSGITELIEDIYKNYPEGFQRIEDESSRIRKCYGKNAVSGRLSQIDGTIAMDLANHEWEGTIAMDLAEQELKYYFVLQRAKSRMRAFLRMDAMLNNLRAGAGKGSNNKTEADIEDSDDVGQKDIEIKEDDIVKCEKDKESATIDTEIGGHGLNHEGEELKVIKEIDESDDLNLKTEELQTIEKETKYVSLSHRENEEEFAFASETTEGEDSSERNENKFLVTEEEIKEDHDQHKNDRDSSYRRSRMEKFEEF